MTGILWLYTGQKCVFAPTQPYPDSDHAECFQSFFKMSVRLVVSHYISLSLSVKSNEEYHDNVMLVMYSEHVSDVMMISQAFTAISSRITGTTLFVKIASNGFRSEVLQYTILGDSALETLLLGDLS